MTDIDLENLKKKLLANAYDFKGPNVRKLFLEIDKSKRGKINFIELSAYLRRRVPKIEDKLIGAMMESADVDQDGQLTEIDPSK